MLLHECQLTVMTHMWCLQDYTSSHVMQHTVKQMRFNTDAAWLQVDA